MIFHYGLELDIKRILIRGRKTLIPFPKILDHRLLAVGGATSMYKLLY